VKAGNTERRFGVDFSGLASAPVVVSATWLGEDDEYLIATDEGVYQLFVVDEAGCGVCVDNELVDGVGHCRLFAVGDGEVVVVDVFLNFAVG
jgi:hypothetical protein